MSAWNAVACAPSEKLPSLQNLDGSIVHSQNKCQLKQDAEVSSSRTNTHVAGTSPQKRRKGGTPVGYLRRIALRREHCGIFAQSKYWGARETAIARLRLIGASQEGSEPGSKGTSAIGSRYPAT
jgi:hypothetical protein